MWLKYFTQRWALYILNQLVLDVYLSVKNENMPLCFSKMYIQVKNVSHWMILHNSYFVCVAAATDIYDTL
jgi:hypothetical protein